MKESECKMKPSNGGSIYDRSHVDSRLVLAISISLILLSSTMLLPTAFAEKAISYLLKFGSTGYGAGELKSPSGIAIDSSGKIYVVDSSNNRVQVFDSSGKYLSQFGSTGYGAGELKSPSGIAIASSGKIYVVDTGNNRIEEFSVLK